MSPVIQQAIPPPTLVNPTQLAAPVIPTVTADAQKRADQQKKQEELQKKLLEETEPQTLQQQENMSIKGQSARHLVMQKLMRKTEVNVKNQKNNLKLSTIFMKFYYIVNKFDRIIQLLFTFLAVFKKF